MPLPDCSCKVINGRTGYVRDNSSWILGRIVRDFESWMDNGQPNGPIHTRIREMLDKKWQFEIQKANKKNTGSGANVKRPSQAGLCVSVYKAEPARPGYPGYDLVYILGFGTAILQLAIAAFPCGLYGDWGILLITAAGILLALATGSISQWSKEKWACRCGSDKAAVLTRGNGSQYAIVILGEGKGLDLEDLAAGPTSVNVAASYTTRITMCCLAVCWIFLLITAAGIRQNTWFILAVGGIGILQNIFVAGWRRSPEAFGIPLTFDRVIGKPKVMDALIEVEETYPHVGRSMLDTFFPGRLRPVEEARWRELEDVANATGHAPAQTHSSITAT